MAEHDPDLVPDDAPAALHPTDADVLRTISGDVERESPVYAHELRRIADLCEYGTGGVRPWHTLRELIGNWDNVNLPLFARIVALAALSALSRAREERERNTRLLESRLQRISDLGCAAVDPERRPCRVCYACVAAGEEERAGNGKS